MVAAVATTEIGAGMLPWAVLAATTGPLLAGWRRGLPCALAALAAAGMLTARHDRRDAQSAMAEQARVGETLVLRMLADARGSANSWAGPARVIATTEEMGRLQGARVWLRGTDVEAPVAGATVLARGRFADARIPRNPGDFDEKAWLRREGLAAVFRAQRGTIETDAGLWEMRRAGIRHTFREVNTAGLEDDGRAALVIRAIVLGEQPPEDEGLLEFFRLSGTMHVFCVSGLHVGMVGLLGWLVFGAAGMPRRWAIALLVPLMFGYAWLTGNGPPALRAATMAAVFLAAFVLRRRPDGLNALGAVLVVMLLWDGRLLFQPGVQLSFGVVAAILAGAALAGRLFKGISDTRVYLPPDEMTRPQRALTRTRRWLAGSLGVSTAAWAGSTPLTAYHFGLITPVSIIATVVQIPIVFALLAAALVSALLHPMLPAASRAINQGNAWLATGCVGAAETAAAIPGGHWKIDTLGGARLVVYNLSNGAGAAVFTDGRGAAVMIDCGDARAFRHQLLPGMRRSGLRPDSVILTHPDGGHLGGGAQVWRSLPIRQALLPVDRARSPAYQEWRHHASADGVAIGIGRAGDHYNLAGGAHIEVLHDPSAVSPNARADDRVMIIRLHWEGWRILFTSDSGFSTERLMLAGGRDISADVIVAGMHRSDLILGDDFLDAVRPRAIITSNASHPPEERLDRERAAYWRASGIQVFDPLESGAAMVTIDHAGKLHINGFLDGSAIVLKPDQTPAPAP